jgi:hypothetical protein
MKKIIKDSTIVFNPALKTVDTGISNFNLKGLYAIINVTKKAIIFATSVAGSGYTAVSGSIVTLEFDTTTHASNDVLQILYDDSEEQELLQSMVELSNRLAFLPSIRGTLADIRVSVVNAPAVSIGSGTITTLSNQTQVGGLFANQQIPSLQNRIAIASNITNIIL